MKSITIVYSFLPLTIWLVGVQSFPSIYRAGSSTTGEDVNLYDSYLFEDFTTLMDPEGGGGPSYNAVSEILNDETLSLPPFEDIPHIPYSPEFASGQGAGSPENGIHPSRLLDASNLNLPLSPSTANTAAGIFASPEHVPPERRNTPNDPLQTFTTVENYRRISLLSTALDWYLQTSPSGFLGILSVEALAQPQHCDVVQLCDFMITENAKRDRDTLISLSATTYITSRDQSVARGGKLQDAYSQRQILVYCFLDTVAVAGHTSPQIRYEIASHPRIVHPVNTTLTNRYITRQGPVVEHMFPDTEDTWVHLATLLGWAQPFAGFPTDPLYAYVGIRPFILAM